MNSVSKLKVSCVFRELNDKHGVLSKVYEVTVPKEDFAKQVDEYILKIGKDAKIKGFRPGKVPLQIIKTSGNFYRDGLKEAINDNIQKTIAKISDECKIEPLGHPEVKISQYGEGEDLLYQLEFNLMPEIPHIDLEALDVSPYVVKITKEDAKKHIDELNEYKLVKIEDKNHQASEGDVLKIDYVGKVDNKFFKGNRASDMFVEVGKGSMLKEVEDGLIKMKIQETKDVECKLPDSCMEASLVGKTAVFQIKVKEIFRKDLIEDTKELLEKFGCDSEEQLMDQFHHYLQNQLDQVTLELNKHQIFRVLGQYTFEVSPKMVKQELDCIRLDPQNKEKEETTLKEEATKRVRLAMIILNLKKELGVILTQEDYSQKIRDKSGNNVELYRYLYSAYAKGGQDLTKLEGEILEDKVCLKIVGKLERKAQIIAMEEAKDLLDKVSAAS